MKVQKKSVLHYYLTAIIINVVIPVIGIFTASLEGDRGLIIVPVLAWAGLHLISFAMYFTIPSFYKKWEKRAAFLFPPLMGVMITVMAPFFMLFVLFNVILAFLFMWHYNNKVLPQTQA
jgi:hypothetical protein